MPTVMLRKFEKVCAIIEKHNNDATKLIPILQEIHHQKIKAVGYCMRHDGPGGGHGDALMHELASFLAQRLPACRHVILSDADIYNSMPGYARSYALPLKYTEAGLVKYGRNGLIHGWALRQLVALKGARAGKVITVFLNDNTDVVAFKDGQPLMSSHGFSGQDGIMSRTGCGAIDTSIVFQLFADGHTRESIEHVLAQESGFMALLGGKAGIVELLGGNDPASVSARDIFAYQLLKAIGAGVAVLEGLDVRAFG